MLRNEVEIKTNNAVDLSALMHLQILHHNKLLNKIYLDIEVVEM